MRETPEGGSSAAIGRIPLWLALLPVAFLIVLLAINVRLFGDSATLGANQIALLVGAAVAAVAGRFLGTPIGDCVEASAANIASSLRALLILLMVGGLLGTWVAAGIVPAMVYYGMQILQPSAFLVLAVVICSVVSMATGSSWTTVGTLGVPLLAIGESMGFGKPVVAGAIISGAYFGDKMSPLSDTTNLAPAMTGADLYSHIRSMLWTTVPTLTVTLVAFAVINWRSTVLAATAGSSELLAVIDREFLITPWLFVVPAILFGMVACRVDPIVALFVAMLLGAAVAVWLQPGVVARIADGTLGNPPAVVADAGAGAEEPGQPEQESGGVSAGGRPSLGIAAAYKGAVMAMALKTGFATGNDQADELLRGKGMEGMLNTIWLVFCSMCFGGAMEATGFLQRITAPMVAMARSTWALVASAAGSCLFVNLTASDQYLAIVVPGRMFRHAFEERGLAPQVLSRTLEDSGTVTSPLVSWNTCGAFHGGVLGVTALSYAPWALFNWISPLMTVLVAFLGIGLAWKQTATGEPND